MHTYYLLVRTYRTVRKQNLVIFLEKILNLSTYAWLRLRYFSVHMPNTACFSVLKAETVVGSLITPVKFVA